MNIIHLIPSNKCSQVPVGQDYTMQLNYETNDGTAIDLTSLTIVGSIKNAAGAEVLALPAQTDAITTGLYKGSDQTLGVINLFISAANSTSTGAGNYTYTISVTDSLPQTNVKAAGNIEFWTLPY